MSLDKERQTKHIVACMQDAEVSTAYATSASGFFEKAEKFGFAAGVLAKVLENLESGAKVPLSEEDLMSLIGQTASLDLMIETVSAAKNEVAESSESHGRMGNDSLEMSRPRLDQSS